MLRFFQRSAGKQDTRALKHEAFKCMEKGRWKQALASWEELVVREPNDLQHRIRLGECLRHLGRTQEAARHWLRAASGWAADQRWDKALAAARLALAEDPFDLDVIHLLDELAKRRTGAVRADEAPPSPRTRDDRASNGLEIDGWIDADRRVERIRAVAAKTSSTQVPRVLVPEVPAPQRVTRAAVPEGAPDAMPETVFEALHAGFSSSAPVTEPRPCRCGRCSACAPARRGARVVPLLGDDAWP